MNPKECPECGSTEIDCQSYKGECHCKECGFVLDDSMPDLAHYREGTSSEGTAPVDGKIVKHPWLLNARQKNIQRARKKLNRIAGHLNLPEYIKKQAYHVYKEAVNKGLCVGRSNASILCGCVYAACNQSGIPKTASDIAKHSGTDKKHLLRSYSMIQKELGLKIGIYDPVDLLPKYVTNLGLSQHCLTKAMEILESTKKTSVYSGKSPQSIAAAVIYIAAKMLKEKVSQREISAHVGVIEVTMRKRYKEIADALQINF